MEKKKNTVSIITTVRTFTPIWSCTKQQTKQKSKQRFTPSTVFLRQDDKIIPACEWVRDGTVTLRNRIRPSTTSSVQWTIRDTLPQPPIRQTKTQGWVKVKDNSSYGAEGKKKQHMACTVLMTDRSQWTVCETRQGTNHAGAPGTWKRKRGEPASQWVQDFPPLK